MAQLIDKDSLVAEIERRIRELEPFRTEDNLRAHGAITGYYQVLSFIDTLEVKEVDLEKEVEKYLLTNAAFLIGGDSKLVVHHIAKHFFELGAKAKEAGYSKPASKDFTFKSIPRILEMVKPSERAKSYCEKLSKSLENEGYPTDAKIVRESIKRMNGEKVSMATMDEEPVSKDLEEAAQNWWEKTRLKSDLSGNPINSFKAGAKWKEEQMMKDVVLETTIIKDWDGCAENGNESEWLAYEDDEVINMPEWCEEGDKVKLILIKRE